MTAGQFLKKLQNHTGSFAAAVATKEGEWIIKGFIDIYRRIYTISVDTKIVSKVLELLLFPMFVEFGKKNGLQIELCPQQNFYPDLTFTEPKSDRKFAVDIKSTYRTNDTEVNGMTLGAFTGCFRNRESNKNMLYPYSHYAGHFVVGVVYSKCDDVADERRQFTLGDLSYWMFYLTRDMAQALSVKRPYANLQEYANYKQKGIESIRAHGKQIAKLAAEDLAGTDDGNAENQD